MQLQDTVRSEGSSSNTETINQRGSLLAGQTAQLNGTPFVFGQGEHIITEYSYKYAAQEFAKLAARSGWTVKRLWTDAAKLFSVQYLEVR